MRLYLSSYGLGNSPEQMLPLIGGEKRTAVIMNAQDAVTPENRAERLIRELDNLTALGLRPQELDLRNYFGKSAELAEAVNSFDYVWVRGGNVFILRQAYAQSGFDTIISNALKADSVAYGGFSAGICVLAPSLKGLELVDDTTATATGYNNDIIWDGLGLLDYTLAPHYKSDHPESADIDKCVEYFIDNHMLFRALRDGQAIVVNGTNETILG